MEIIKHTYWIYVLFPFLLCSKKEEIYKKEKELKAFLKSSEYGCSKCYFVHLYTNKLIEIKEACHQK